MTVEQMNLNGNAEEYFTKYQQNTNDTLKQMIRAKTHSVALVVIWLELQTIVIWLEPNTFTRVGRKFRASYELGCMSRLCSNDASNYTLTAFFSPILRKLQLVEKLLVVFRESKTQWPRARVTEVLTASSHSVCEKTTSDGARCWCIGRAGSDRERFWPVCGVGLWLRSLWSKVASCVSAILFLTRCL